MFGLDCGRRFTDNSIGQGYSEGFRVRYAREEQEMKSIAVFTMALDSLKLYHFGGV